MTTSTFSTLGAAAVLLVSVESVAGSGVVVTGVVVTGVVVTGVVVAGVVVTDVVGSGVAGPLPHPAIKRQAASCKPIFVRIRKGFIVFENLT
ncbi:MAG: hypothetical protein OXI84_05440 [bacterium]|nr:hypothetical protein [bacterium]